ncbi:MAG: hypothetical protein WC824_00100 [Bacteroidota bacterium]|jgi:hypothetical protein
MTSFIGRERELFDFMRQRGIPVYHLSNLFIRDIQAAIRDFYRDKNDKDLGTREIDRLASEFVSDLEKRNVIVAFRPNTYILHMEDYQLKPTIEESRVEGGATEAVPV